MDLLELIALRCSNLDLSELDCSPRALSERKIASYNKTPGTYDEINCTECLNKGRIAYLRQDDSVGYLECTCMSMRRCIWQMEKSGLSRDIFRQSTFSRFDASQPWQAAAKQRAQAYAADPQGWFLACGQSGSGKSHLCTAICTRLLMSGQPLRYLSWRSVIGKLKSFDEGPALMDAYVAAPNLYIDDLFKGGAGPEGLHRPSAADISVAFQLIDSRSRNGLRTILSTELMPEELAAIDQATAGRILEKTGEKNLLVIERDIRKNHRLKGIVKQD